MRSLKDSILRGKNSLLKSRDSML